MKYLILAMLAGCGSVNVIHHDNAGHCWEERDDGDDHRHFIRYLPANQCTFGGSDARP